ncbi:hypothetical protein JAAARDRAFT_273139 [Jaapia argillacea MUCL 33604]|uniref:XPG-I domain-containing protein n=1 Tax=Jaapia argillacea MUCL 33604 TaxID=933084 RepID=A0A067PSC6_9AGAM|nr:hypothetical protein JAAARDRAFT_273139 [Jaapia argillacea MUCL 33604]
MFVFFVGGALRRVLPGQIFFILKVGWCCNDTYLLALDMGVQGLWDIINKAGVSRSLTHLAVVEGFEANTSGRRAFRVGIDASIWYQHARFSKGGENPELRLLFFRVRALAELPLLPLFVFDGRERPKVKRGSKMGKSGSHNLTAGMKKLLDIFGMEWRMALGEAEAELAHLNQIGVIDAVMTDDVDALVFGARTIIKNPGLTLSGNKSNPALNSEGKASKHHVMLYTADAMRTHPEIALTRGGLILFALLCGGDYNEGVPDVGKQIAHGLARCGFGDQLLAAYQQRDFEPIQPFLAQWRVSVNNELHSNSRGFFPHKYVSLSLPPDFPNLKVMENYANPVNSARAGRQGGGQMRDNGDLNLARIAGFCEEHFGEWGHKSTIIKRFRDLLWEASVIRVLRRAALEVDEKEKNRRIAQGRDDLVVLGPLSPSRAEAVGTGPSVAKKYLSIAVQSDEDRRAAAFVNNGSGWGNVAASGSRTGGEARRSSTPDNADPLLLKIVGTRRHVSTDNILEYRIELKPTLLISLTKSGIRGTRPDPPTGPGVGGNVADDILDAILDGASQRSAPKSPKKPPPDPESVMRIWLPASMVRQVHPDLVADYEAAEQAKKDGTNKQKGKVKAVAPRNGEGEVANPAKPKRKRAAQTRPKQANDGDSIEGEAPKAAPKKRQTKAKATPAVPSVDVDATVEPASGNGSGFLFSMANPDDPILVDDSEPDGSDEHGERTRFDAIFDQIMGPRSSQAPKKKPRKATAATAKKTAPMALPTAPSSAVARSLEVVQARNPGTSTQASSRVSSSRRNSAPVRADLENLHVDLSDQESDEGLPDRFDMLFDQIMGKGASSQVSRASTHGSSQKRGRRSEPVPSSSQQLEQEEIELDEGLGVRPEPKRRKTAIAPFPDIPPLSNPSPPHRAPLRPRVATNFTGADVIEIDSDSDTPAPFNAGATLKVTTRPSHGVRRIHAPSSSQNSGLFDAEDIIDLT